MDTNLSPEQQALFASIMGNSSQINAVAPVQAPQSGPVATTPSTTEDDPNRMLSQAEIDALIASMVG